MSYNDQLKDVMGGYNPHNELLSSSRKLVSKWEPTGLLEGMKNESETSGMAVLLENQAKQLIDEASNVGTSANQEQWSGVALPLVRRIFAELSAQEFVSVQPMNLPSGLIFYLDFKYGSTQQSGALYKPKVQTSMVIHLALVTQQVAFMVPANGVTQSMTLVLLSDIHPQQLLWQM